MPTSTAKQLAQALTALGRAEPPAAIHCAGGRDRTGIACGMALWLAGAEPDTIAADHALSDESWGPHNGEWLAAAPDDQERERRRRISEPAGRTLAEVLEEIEQREGIRNLLLGAGADETALDRLTARLARRGVRLRSLDTALLRSGAWMRYVSHAAARTRLVGADAPLPRAGRTRRPVRTPAGYRLYGLRELNQLRSLAELRRSFGVEIGDFAFAARLRREPDLRTAIDGWLADVEDASWVEWEQRKHERLLAA